MVVGGHNRILGPDQHQTLIQYATDQATRGGMGATKQMMFNCSMLASGSRGEACSKLEVVSEMAKKHPRTSHDQDKTDCEAPR